MILSFDHKKFGKAECIVYCLKSFYTASVYEEIFGLILYFAKEWLYNNVVPVMTYL